MNFKKIICVFLLSCILAAGYQPSAVGAQSGSAGDLISAVNVYRANYGLAPYSVDPNLMSLAQQHSEYQASIGKITHTRADGTTPADLGITSENVGGGSGTSIDSLINYQWSDYWHTHTLIGYTAANVGAGVAWADGSVYYTLIVVRTGSMTNMMETVSAGGGSNPAAPAITPKPGSTPAAGITARPAITGTQPTATPFATPTPREDGAIVHVVSAGETLWSIALAYNLSEQRLKDINGFTQDNPTIYVGNKLFISLPYTATPTATITTTPLPPTITPLPTRTPRLLLFTPTAGEPLPPTAVPMLPPLKENGEWDRKSVGFWVLFVCLIGLIAAFVSNLKKR